MFICLFLYKKNIGSHDSSKIFFDIFLLMLRINMTNTSDFTNVSLSYRTHISYDFIHNFNSKVNMLFIVPRVKTNSYTIYIDGLFTDIFESRILSNIFFWGISKRRMINNHY
jgi:hypothetical protein